MPDRNAERQQLRRLRRSVHDRGTTSQTVASGNCYLLTLTGTDNVGNAATITTTVKVDTTAPSAPTGLRVLRADELVLSRRGLDRLLQGRQRGRLHVDGVRLDRRRLRGSLPTTTARSPAPAGPTPPASTRSPLRRRRARARSQRRTAPDVTGAATSFTAQSDSTTPAGGAFTANAVAATGGGSSSVVTAGTTLTINSRTDYTEAQTATASGLASSTLTMQSRRRSPLTAAAPTARRHDRRHDRADRRRGSLLSADSDGHGQRRQRCDDLDRR